MSDQQEILPTEITPEPTPVVEEVVIEPNPEEVVVTVVEQPPVVEEVVIEPNPEEVVVTVVEQPPVVEEVVPVIEPNPEEVVVTVVEQPPVVEEVVPVIELTNEEILLDFATLKSSQSGLIRRGAITTLSLNGVTDPTEQEIADTVCALFKQHLSWEALVELDSRFYR